MSEKLNKCCQRLKEDVQTAESHLVRVGKHLASAAEAAGETLESHLTQAVEKCDSEREHAAKATERIKDFLHDAKETTIAKYEEWKTDREIEKIENDAERLEEIAVDSIVVAAFAIMEAEVAVVKALRARKVAIEVAG